MVSIEVGNNPDSIGTVILHSSESGQFMAVSRLEFEALAADIKRGSSTRSCGHGRLVSVRL
jgi:hypothetical protein